MRYLIVAIRTPHFKHSVIDAHKEYLTQLKEDGRLVLSGPFTDNSGGAYVIEANNIESAKAIAFNDPIHLSGSSIKSVYEWDAV